jgi:hypothetical protein
MTVQATRGEAHPPIARLCSLKPPEAPHEAARPWRPSPAGRRRSGEGIARRAIRRSIKPRGHPGRSPSGHEVRLNCKLRRLVARLSGAGFPAHCNRSSRPKEEPTEYQSMQRSMESLTHWSLSAKIAFLGPESPHGRGGPQIRRGSRRDGWRVAPARAYGTRVVSPARRHSEPDVGGSNPVTCFVRRPRHTRTPGDIHRGDPRSARAGGGSRRRCHRSQWARLDSNQRTTNYEFAALPLSYRPFSRQP